MSVFCAFVTLFNAFYMRKNLLLLFLFLGVSCFCFSQTEDPHFTKAREYAEKKNFASALEEINLALVKDFQNPEYLVLKGNVLGELEKYKESYEAFTRAIEANPTYSIAFNQRGLLLLKFRETDAAIRDFNKALSYEKADTMRMSLLLNRGVAKKNVRNFQEAYEDFSLALKYDTVNVGILNNLAAVSDEIGKGDQVLGYLFRILALDSSFVGAWVNIGFKYQGLGKHDSAVYYFNKALLVDPEEPLTFNNRAYSKLKLGDLAGALSDVNRSIKLYPGNSYAYRNRALIYLAMKRKTDACQDIEEALRQGFTEMYGDEVEKLKKEKCEESPVQKT